MQKDYKVNLYADEIHGTRKSLRKFKTNANKSGNTNLLLSGVSGIGMGILGIGIPDIPIFTGMILKNIYEIALHYGFDYESETEKYFILQLIEGAVSYGDHFIAIENQLENFIHTPQLSEGYSQSEQISEYAKIKYQKRFLLEYKAKGRI